MIILKNTIFKRILIIYIYSIAMIALIFITIEFIININLNSGSGNEIETLVLKFYKDADKGNYEDLYNITIEGKWVENDAKIDQNYSFVGVVEKDYFIKRSIEDFGEDGWKIYATSIEVIDGSKMLRSEFLDDFYREGKILNYIDPKENTKYINIVEVKGYSVGICTIREWRRKIPILWFNDSWKIVLPGSPENLFVLRKEDLYANIEFKNVENNQK